MTIETVKILHLLDTCNRGGAEAFVLDLCRNWRMQEGISPHFAILQGGSLEADFSSSGISGAKLGRKLPVDPRTIWKLRRFIEERDIQVVHTHGNVDLLYTHLATWGTRVTHVHTCHGYNQDLPAKDQWVLKKFLARANANIFVSQPAYEYFKNSQRTSKLCRVIENGVDSRKLNVSSIELAEFRGEFGMPGSVPLIGMVGNFVNTGRDQMTVCRALHELKKAGGVFRFLFVGRRNPDRPELFDGCVSFCREHGLEQDVLFIGGRNDVPRILLTLDLFVYASNHDTFGIAVVEAMMSGIPAVVNDLAPFQVMGERGRYLHLYPSKDYVGLAKILGDYLRDATPYREMALKARKHALARYGMERVLKEYGDVYKAVVAAKGPGRSEQ